MRHMLPAAALCLALNACAPLPGDPFHGERAGLSARTQWTRAVSRYSDRQKEALDYAIRCDAALSATVQPCDTVVDDMAAVDRVAKSIQQDGEEALVQDDTARLNGATGHLDAVTDQLTFILLRGVQ